MNRQKFVDDRLPPLIFVGSVILTLLLVALIAE